METPLILTFRLEYHVYIALEVNTVLWMLMICQSCDHVHPDPINVAHE